MNRPDFTFDSAIDENFSYILMTEKFVAELEKMFKPGNVIYGMPIITIRDELIPKRDGKKFLYALISKDNRGQIDFKNSCFVYGNEE